MELILGDITAMRTDAIAAAAHSDLRPSPGISEAIFRAADTRKLMDACRAVGSCRIGQAVVTPSCGLPCRYIVHVVGPGWYSGRKAERLLFADCYRKALCKAYAYHCRSIALPLMFSGEYHIPRAQAIGIACRVIGQFESVHPGVTVYLVLYKESIYRLAEKIYRELA